MYASEPPPGKSQKLLQTDFINVIGMPMVIAFELHENPGVSGESVSAILIFARGHRATGNGSIK